MDATQQPKIKKTRAPKAATAVAQPKVKETKPKKEVKPKKAPTPVKVDDSLTFVATSRIKTYINDNKLNKNVNQILEIIKNAKEFKTDLTQLLSADQQELVGQYRETTLKAEKQKADSNAKLGKPVEDVESITTMDPYTVAEKAFTRSKVKFSKDSFQVVGIVVDKILYELVVHTMDNMLEQAKLNNISVKYISVDKSSPLYPIYSNCKTFKSLESTPVALTDVSADAEAEVETESNEDNSTDSKVNFECYIRKIIDKVKSTDEKYTVFKNSTPFKKFCSDLVLDVLDRICNILETISINLHFKTINKGLFVTIFKIMICDQNGPHSDEPHLFDEVNTILAELVKQKEETNAQRKADKEAKA